MKAKTYLAATFILTLVSVRADMVIVQEMESAITGKVRTTMSIKGAKVRTDAGPENSVIIDTATGDMTTLMHEEKMVVKMNTKDMAAAAATVTGKEVPTEGPKLVKTGESEKVGEFECDIYTMEVMGTKSKMWIARDYPGYEKFKKEMSVLGKLAGAGGKSPDMPGLALKTVTEAGGATYTTLMVSLKESKIDDALFTVPEGYKGIGE